MCESNLPAVPSQFLPAITNQTLPAISQITEALGLPREVVASDENIQCAWNDIPRELRLIPPELRNEALARMCIAIATGLFDGAINYIWNASIVQLRQRVRDFGLNVVTQILSKTFEEQALIYLQDADLLNLCLKLNLISEEGFFFLNQCRDTRNNFSAAHPTMGMVNDRELIVFINRCAQHALSTTIYPKGVDINAFIQAIKGDLFNEEQQQIWISRLSETHDAQRELLLGMLHGIYCDPDSSEDSRLNALGICQSYSKDFTSKTKSDILDSHYDYQAKGDTQRLTASRTFFEKLGFLSMLNDIEKHAMISSACDNMLSVHMAFNNFYNEPSFATRLLELLSQVRRPDTIKEKFVLAVVTCYVGNLYGVSRAAIPYYEKMVYLFTPREISILLELPRTKTILGDRIKQNTNCKIRFKQCVSLIRPESVPQSIKAAYTKIVS